MSSQGLWIHEKPIGDKYINKTRDTDHIGAVIDLGDAASTIMKLEHHLKWVMQTVHQGNHIDHEGYWWECPKNTCKSTADLLRELMK